MKDKTELDLMGPLKILMVEDDRGSRVLLERQLREIFPQIAEIKTADSIEAALELLDGTDFDTVLLDLNLPDSRGMGTLDKIAKKDPYVPIVVITGDSCEEIGLEAVANGAQEYLVKGGYNKDALTKAIRYAIERKKAQQQLQSAEEKYRSIFENSAVAITVANEQEQLVSWNKFTEDLLGMSKEDLYLKPIKSFYPVNEWKKIRSYNIKEKGSQHHLETLMLGKDGRPIDVDISISVLKDSEGRITSSVGIIRNISERKQAEKKLVQVQAAVDNATDAIVITNLNGKVLYLNNAFGDFFNHSVESINDINFKSIFVDVNTFREATNNILNSSSWEDEIQMISTDKHQFPVHMRGTPVLDEQGNVFGMLFLINDITERKEAERKLKETVELKSHFVSTVSHELRTPLTCIKEAVTIVMDGMAGKVNKKQKSFLDIAKRNIDRLSTLVNEVLDFQKLELNKMEFDIRWNRIDKAVQDVYTTMRSYAENSDVNFIVTIDDNLPEIMFDNDKIIQVLSNLVSNAVKFTPVQGQVCLCVQQQNGELAMSVSDTGMGIPKQDLPRIFERFYRVNRPGKQISGTGLGLAIVEKIVNMHDGRVEVESEPGKGTTFTVYLPITAQLAKVVELAK